MRRIFLPLTITKKGYPALWEAGGGMTNTGDAQIICGPRGQRKSPIYVRRRGHLAGGEHALFIVKRGDVVVEADHHRGDFNIRLWRIVGFDERDGEPVAEAEMLDEFSMGEWSGEAHRRFRAAIEAAREKAVCYHCREPHYAALDD